MPRATPQSSAETATADFLRAAGLRRTPVRAGVVEVLSAATRPLSVPQILGQLKHVDSVTVYRTLNTFVKKRLVHRIRGEDRSWLYAMGSPVDDQPAHKHPHFVCESCGKVECIEGANIPADLPRTLGVAAIYRVSYTEVVVHGNCPSCK